MIGGRCFPRFPWDSATVRPYFALPNAPFSSLVHLVKFFYKLSRFPVNFFLTNNFFLTVAVDIKLGNVTFIHFPISSWTFVFKRPIITSYLLLIFTNYKKRVHAFIIIIDFRKHAYSFHQHVKRRYCYLAILTRIRIFSRIFFLSIRLWRRLE